MTAILAICLQMGAGEAYLASAMVAGQPASAPRPKSVDTAHAEQASGNSGQWIALPDERLQVRGLPWLEENAPLLWRLPKAVADKMPPGVKRLMRFPPGARVRFASDTSSLRARLKASQIYSFGNMSPIGSRGLGVYVDGTYWASATVKSEGDQELTFFQGAPKKSREITIYLPSYQEVAVSEIGVDADAQIGPPAPFAKSLPIVFYGSSIAQGASASRPGMSYEAILARRLNVDFVNLGFSGSGKAEPEVVDLVAGVEACCYVFDLGKSYGIQPVEVYADMLRKVRAAHPEVPLVCITPIFSTRELYDPRYVELSQHIRAVVAKAARGMIDAGDANVHLVDGLELLGPSDADCFQEGVHPTDLGFTRIADGLEPVLREAVRLADR